MITSPIVKVKWSPALERPFEANIDFEVRFMADAKVISAICSKTTQHFRLVGRWLQPSISQVVGCNWIELPPGAWKQRNPNEYKSRAQVASSSTMWYR